VVGIVAYPIAGLNAYSFCSGSSPFENENSHEKGLSSLWVKAIDG
jgi:hypothetical protein